MERRVHSSQQLSLAGQRIGFYTRYRYHGRRHVDRLAVSAGGLFVNSNVRRGAVISGLIHLAALLALIISLPPVNMDQSDSAGDVGAVFAPSQQALQEGKKQAPKDMKLIKDGAFSDLPPKPRPFAPPPPPPPPPQAREINPHPSTAASTSQTSTQTPDARPTLPTRQPQPPQIQAKMAEAKRSPLPPEKQPPAPQQSAQIQPKIVQTPDQLSRTVDDTLNKYRAEEKQVKPPVTTYNQQAGGAPDGGGSLTSTSNSRLSGLDRNAIGNHVRPCWGVDTGALGEDHFSVQLIVQTDAAAIVHNAIVAPADQSKLSDFSFAAFAGRAIDAVMNYRCATLPLPASMRGQPQTFLFDFRP